MLSANKFQWCFGFFFYLYSNLLFYQDTWWKKASSQKRYRIIHPLIYKDILAFLNKIKCISCLCQTLQLNFFLSSFYKYSPMPKQENIIFWIKIHWKCSSFFQLDQKKSNSSIRTFRIVVLSSWRDFVKVKANLHSENDK